MLKELREGKRKTKFNYYAPWDMYKLSNTLTFERRGIFSYHFSAYDVKDGIHHEVEKRTYDSPSLRFYIKEGILVLTDDHN